MVLFNVLDHHDNMCSGSANDGGSSDHLIMLTTVTGNVESFDHLLTG